MTRRRLIAWLLAAIASAASLLAAWRHRLDLVDRVFAPRLDSRSPTGRLTEAELASVVALGEVVVSAASLPPDEHEALRAHVEDRTTSRPGYLALYRASAHLLDRLAGTPFARADWPTRLRLVEDHRLGSEVQIREYLWPLGRQELALRALAVPDLILGYYLSAAGWSVVGYETFPGRCGDLTRYTRRES